MSGCDAAGSGSGDGGGETLAPSVCSIGDKALRFFNDLFTGGERTGLKHVAVEASREAAGSSCGPLNKRVRDASAELGAAADVAAAAVAAAAVTSTAADPVEGSLTGGCDRRTRLFLSRHSFFR